MSAKPSRRRRGGGRIDPVRWAAARLLVDWQEGPGSAAGLVRAWDRREEGGARFEIARRRRLRELVFGCVRLRGRYDYLIDRLSRRRPEPRLRAVLWLGLHEISELSTPPHAAVSSAVELARGLGLAHATGFVNGVLRRVLRDGIESFFPDPRRDPIAYARSWASHPEWLLRRWAERLEEEELLSLCAANNRRPSLVLRAARGRRDELLHRAEELGWEASAGRWSPDAVVLASRVPAPLVLQQLPGPPAIQDEAAQVVPELLLPERPRRVLDLCAAPGGKAMQLGELLGGEAVVVAADRSFRRLKRLAESRRRLGRGSPLLLVADGRRPPLPGAGFEAVLLDAPCTGTGVLARRHEARWRRSARDLETLPALQVELLHSAVDLCAPGGIIVYATCSLEPEENDAVVDRVLAERGDLRELGAQGRVAPELLQGQRVQIWPQRHGCDGAFAAVLQRTEKNA